MLADANESVVEVEYCSRLHACPSYSLYVQLFWYRCTTYYPEWAKARVSPVQSIEPHRILIPTQELNQRPPGPQSRIVTTILALHMVLRVSHQIQEKWGSNEGLIHPTSRQSRDPYRCKQWRIYLLAKTAIPPAMPFFG